jgi:hypothetical protein
MLLPDPPLYSTALYAHDHDDGHFRDHDDDHFRDHDDDHSSAH